MHDEKVTATEACEAVLRDNLFGLELDPGHLGRASVYDGFDPNPPGNDALDASGEAETCLGVGAHTHYLEPDQKE